MMQILNWQRRPSEVWTSSDIHLGTLTLISHGPSFEGSSYSSVPVQQDGDNSHDGCTRMISLLNFVFLIRNLNKSRAVLKAQHWKSKLGLLSPLSLVSITPLTRI